MLVRVSSLRVSARRGLSSSSRARRSTKDLLPASLPGPLVSTSWLANHLPSVKVLDCSYFVATQHGNGSASFLDARIPGAGFFDLDYVCAKDSDLPHMFPSEAEFNKIFAGEMGLSASDNIVLYDCQGMFSAPRVWFTLRTFGVNKVGVLSGGLPMWQRDGFSVATGPSFKEWKPLESAGAKYNPAMVASYEDVVKNIETGEAILVDARSPGRFEGVEPEPRPGMKHGHVPGALNLPFSYLYDDFSQVLRPVPALKAVFARAGVDLSDSSRPIITMCGSGVTASILALGLHVVGHTNVSVYDGSWTDYGSRYESEVETGPPRIPRK